MMIVSFVMRRYTAEIYRLQQEQPEVKISDLAEHVDASVQAVSRMVRRLRKGGYLTYEPYRGVRLTAEGERIAMPAFLCTDRSVNRNLGYSLCGECIRE